jgi:hypothetical protein
MCVPVADRGRADRVRSRPRARRHADIKTTHGPFPADEGCRYRRRRDWHDDYDDDEYSDGSSASEREYGIQELIHSDITLTHWTGPEGTRLEE